MQVSTAGGTLRCSFSRRSTGPSSLSASRPAGRGRPPRPSSPPLTRPPALTPQPAGGPWEAPTPFFSSSGTTYVDVISLDVQSDGAAVATWRVWDFMDDSFSLFARVFTPETGWAATQQLPDRLFTPSGIVAAQAPGGSALVLFSPPSNSTYTLSLAQFPRGVGCAGWSG